MFKIMVHWTNSYSSPQYPMTEYNGWEEVDEADTVEEAADMATEYAMAFQADQGNCVVEVLARR
jgi:hypothetical protein